MAMGRRSPGAVLIGIGKAGTILVDICKTTGDDFDPARLWLAVDTVNRFTPDPTAFSV
jgi:hypothetical protein